MTKSRFKILGFRCYKSDKSHRHYIHRMQRSLYQYDGWTMFFKGVEADEESQTVTLYNRLFDDELIYGTDNIAISVCAIVGKNGSGKSSILDMIIRILNNAATALIGEDVQYAAAEHLHYIENVYGEVLFLQGEELYRLQVDGDDVSIFSYRGEQTTTSWKYRQIGSPNRWLNSEAVKEGYLIPCKKQKLEELAGLFYTIVCNYSLYAYNYADYFQEVTAVAKLKRLKKKPNLKEFPQDQVWLTGLFHKNDGYQTPVVINPMRNGGIIHGPKENRLAKERILSLLFVRSKDHEHKKGVYRFPFRTINGNLRIMELSMPLRADAAFRWTPEWMVERGFFGRRSRLYTDYKKYYKLIFEYFREWYGLEETTRYSDHALRYLVYKIYKIGITYRRYNKIISNLRHKDMSESLLESHLRELIEDTTHITVKFRRTFLYLLYGDQIYPYGDGREAHSRGVYSLAEIERNIAKPLNENNAIAPPFIAKEEDFLPPPIFDVEFRIYKNGQDNWNEKYNEDDLIPFWSLSSGERQIAYSISNFAYHIVNVNSVWNSKAEKVGGMPLLKYHYINVIFDEIELYYHPELQRRFLTLLLNTIRDIDMKNIWGINIMLVTHSPFVLSDIPRSNVLAMGGADNMDETFCANIHDMLSQSFFMNYSMGQYAQTLVEDLFKTYRGFENAKDKKKYVNSLDNWKRYSYVSRTIADEYLRRNAQRMVEEMFSYFDCVPDISEIDKEVEALKKRIEELESIKDFL